MLILALLTLTAADLPVHCTYRQLLGEWTFSIDRSTFEGDLDNQKTQCGHGQPGQVQSFPQSHTFELSRPQTVTVTFEEPNIAHSDSFGSGTWTLIYDEAFLLDFDDTSFMAQFFYYEDGGAYTSDCGRTMLGWFRGSDPSNHRGWGCFYAIKSEPTEAVAAVASTERWVQPESISFLQQPAKLYEDYAKATETINKMQSSWTAGINERFQGQTMLQINMKIGSKLKQPPANGQTQPSDTTIGPVDPRYLSQTDAASLIYYWNTHISSIPTEELPRSWDWSDINGINFVSSKVREQGSCGSCYAVTTVEMLESRLRVLTNNEFDDFLSEQYLVSCSFYTEGCDGGYPTLLNKFIQEFEIVSWECMPYEASNAECKFECDDEDFRASVSDYYYVGGFYGATTEENMMKELRARGPFIADLSPSYDFMYYRSGVYSSVSNREETDGISDVDMRDMNMDWEKVTHSVLLVGWGEENGEKYWKCLNSWGKYWGEEGYFKIKRGVDEASIESMGEAAIPVLINY